MTEQRFFKCDQCDKVFTKQEDNKEVMVSHQPNQEIKYYHAGCGGLLKEVDSPESAISIDEQLYLSELKIKGILYFMAIDFVTKNINLFSIREQSEEVQEDTKHAFLALATEFNELIEKKEKEIFS